MNIEEQYLDMLRKLLKAPYKEDRTGTGTRSLFGYQLRHDFGDGFPLITTKKVHFKGIGHELLWFISGNTNTKYLEDNGITIWREWQDTNGDLGAIYGKQWRNWNGIDQLANVIEQIKTNPDSRRHIVSAWNVSELDQMALPPCHYAFQFYVLNGQLSCMFNMRSCDALLGFCYNVASYALLTMMVAQQCNLGLGELVVTLGDVHLYSNHIKQAEEQISRKPFDFPQVFINKKDSIDEYRYEDFELRNYNSHPTIKAPIAV